MVNVGPGTPKQVCDDEDGLVMSIDLLKLFQLSEHDKCEAWRGIFGKESEQKLKMTIFEHFVWQKGLNWYQKL